MPSTGMVSMSLDQANLIWVILKEDWRKDSEDFAIRMAEFLKAIGNRILNMDLGLSNFQMGSNF